MVASMIPSSPMYPNASMTMVPMRSLKNPEPNVGIHDTLLTHVSECKHDNGSNEELEESSCGGWTTGRLEDQVELNHLQRHSDAPVNVPVDDWGLVHLDPVLAPVHINMQLFKKP